jgi:hypothetical protein
MALFGRGKPASKPPVREAPPSLSRTDLADAARLMDRWDSSLGNSDATWDCLEAIGRRGGFRGDQATLMEIMDGKDAKDVTQRPWRWWHEAARLASASGDHVLAARVFLFAHLFVNQMVDKMSAGDMLETGLDRPSSAIYKDVAKIAVTALSQLPADLLIHDTATGKVDATNALRLAEQVSGVTAGPPLTTGRSRPNRD